MNYNVGDMISYYDFTPRSTSDIPAGAVLLFPSGDAHTLSPAGTWWVFTSGLISELGEVPKDEPVFKLIHLPEQNETEKLAQQLWEVRNEALSEDYPWKMQGVDQKKVYLALAEFMQEKHSVDSPAVILDGDGDRWTRNDRGLYDADDYYSETFRDQTLARIRDQYGTVSAEV